MTNHHILNIGLMAGDVEILATSAFKAMRGAGILWETARQFESDSEPTLVVECDATDHQVHLLATWLEQDCIAVWDRMHREGRLVGPNAKVWGEFDPAKFILPNGSMLSQARSVA